MGSSRPDRDGDPVDSTKQPTLLDTVWRQRWLVIICVLVASVPQHRNAYLLGFAFLLYCGSLFRHVHLMVELAKKQLT